MLVSWLVSCRHWRPLHRNYTSPIPPPSQSPNSEITKHSAPKSGGNIGKNIGKKSILVPGYVRAKGLADRLGVKVKEVEKFCREKRIAFKKHNNIVLDFAHAEMFAKKHGFKIELEDVDAVRRDYWDVDNNNPGNPRRPLIVSVMGHVDHGKTTLLDSLRNTNVVAGEPGRITQALSAFTVTIGEEEGEISEKYRYKTRMTMLDTPGHDAFFLMRENSNSVSDCLLLVISATEGMQAQTKECINIALETNVPIIVAINKIDIATSSQIESVYKELKQLEILDPQFNVDQRNITKRPETEFSVKNVIEISALKKTNIDILKRALFELGDQIEQYLKPDFYSKNTECTVIESHFLEGLGQVLRVIVHWGCLQPNTWFVTDKSIGMIRNLYEVNQIGPNSTGTQQINIVKRDCAWPGEPISIVGFKDDEFPPTGSGLFTLPKEEAQKVHEFRTDMMEFQFKKMYGAFFIPDKKKQIEEDEEVFSEDENGPKWVHFQSKEDQDLALPIIIKADNVGRLETIIGLLETLAEENDVNVNIILKGVGDVTTSDINHAVIEVEENKAPTVPVYLFGESIKLEANARKWIRNHQNDFSQIQIKHYQIIYDIIKDIKVQMKHLLKEKKQTKSTNTK